MKWSAQDAAAAVHGRVVRGDAGRVARGVSTDSRTITAGQGFVALSGERFDGNEFAGKAAKAGAAWVMVSRKYDPSKVPGAAAVIAVDDTLAALGDLAAAWRMQSRAKVVAITGSIGKSTTKEFVAAVLATKGRVLKNKGNLNNQVGLPQTLFGLTAAHDFAVVEMGANHPGEIRSLMRIARPDAGLITRIAPVHLEGFGSLEGVERAKGELIAGLKPEGTFIVNLDDPRVVRRARGFAGRLIGFGRGESDFAGEWLRVLGVDKEVTGDGPRILFRIERRKSGKKAGRPVEFALPGLSRHNADNAAAAAALGLAFGVPLGDAARALRGASGLSGRGDVIRTRRGVIVINDCYNSSPEAVREALETMAWWKGPRRGVAVLGEMLELGPYAQKYHKEAGERAAKAGVELLIAVGPSAKEMAAAAVAAGMAPEAALAAADHAGALRLLKDRLKKGDWVLVKGSRALGLERVVAGIGE